MNTNIELLYDDELAKFAEHNCPELFLPVVEELTNRLMSYNDMFAELASLCDMDVEQLKEVIATNRADADTQRASVIVKVLF